MLFSKNVLSSITLLFSVHGKNPRDFLPGPKIPITKGFSKALPICMGALSLLIIMSDFESSAANSSKRYFSS